MKVGDYVRTNSGDIGIIINCPEQLKKDYGNWLWFETINEQRPIRNEDIIKLSPNIIDLIEVGDYVNGVPVLHKENDELVCGLLLVLNPFGGAVTLTIIIGVFLVIYSVLDLVECIIIYVSNRKSKKDDSVKEAKYIEKQ